MRPIITQNFRGSTFFPERLHFSQRDYLFPGETFFMGVLFDGYTGYLKKSTEGAFYYS